MVARVLSALVLALPFLAVTSASVTGGTCTKAVLLCCGNYDGNTYRASTSLALSPATII